jgi:hypothetical protein
MKKNNIIRVTYIDNCSHGYYSISKADVLKLGIAEKITGFSGLTFTRVYLEEDCDGLLLYNTAKEKGFEIVVKSSYNPKFKYTHNYKFKLFNWVPEVGDYVCIYKNEYRLTKIFDTYFEIVKDGMPYKLSRSNPFAKITDVKK